MNGLKNKIELVFEKNDLDLSLATPYCVELFEGISVPFKANITLVSKSLLSKSSLSKHLNAKVGLILSVNSNADLLKKSRRYFVCGIITQWRSKGLLKDVLSESKALYQYEITVESSVSKLAHAKRSQKYDNTNVLELIKNIFKSHDITEFKYEDTLENSLQSEQRKYVVYSSFNQTDETDLSFVNRLCAHFGLNYTVEYSLDKNSNKCTETVILSDTWRVTKAATDNFLDDKDIEVDLVNTKKDSSLNLILKNNFDDYFSNYYVNSAEYSQTIDKVTFDDYKNSADFSNLKNNFYSNDKLINQESEINLFSKSVSGLIENLQHYALFSAYDLIDVPGLIFKLSFDGEDPTDENYLIARSYLKYNVELKFDQTLEQSDIERKFLAVEINTQDEARNTGNMSSFPDINAKAGFDNYTNTININSILASLNRTDVSQKNLINTDNSGSATIGIVCKNDGKTTVENGENRVCLKVEDNANSSSIFYAKLNEEAEPVEVHLVSMNGENLLSTSFPRIGQKIVMLKISNAYYYMGNVSIADNFPNMVNDLRSDLSQSTLFSFDSAKDQDYLNYSNSDINANYFGFLSFKDPKSYIKHLILQGTFDAFITSLEYKINKNLKDDIYDLCINKITNGDNNQVGYSLVKIDLNTLQNNIITTRVEYNSEKDSEKKRKKAELLNNLYLELDNSAEKIVDKLKEKAGSYVKGNKRNPIEAMTDSLNLQTNGESNINIMSKGGDLSVYAGEEFTARSQGTTTVEAEEINLIANKKMTFQVGNSELTIDNNGITLYATKCSKVGFNIFDSTLSVDALTGISASGHEISLNAFKKAEMADYFGGSVVTEEAGVSLDGVNIDLSTLTRPDVFGNILETINDVAQASSATAEAYYNADKKENDPKYKKRGEADQKISNIVTKTLLVDLNKYYRASLAMAKIYQKHKSAPDEVSTFEVVIAFLKRILNFMDKVSMMVIDLVDNSATHMGKTNEGIKNWKKANEDGISGKDIYKMTMACTQDLLTLTTIASAYIAIFSTGEHAEASLEPDGWSANGKKKSEWFQSVSQVMTAVATQCSKKSSNP